MLKILIVAASVWMVMVPSGASAHGTGYRIVSEKAVVMEFFYSDQKPMQYSEVLIFSPENNTIEYQNGRTDLNGRFAFLPESSGTWQVNVNDGVGHAVSAAVPVNLETTDRSRTAQTGDTSQKHPAVLDGISKGVRLFFGFSLLANFFLGLYVWKRRPG